MQMTRIDLAGGNRDVLIRSTSALIGYPFVSNGSVYFVSSVEGTDDIYSINLSDRNIFRLAAGETGKYYPSVYKDSLVWSAFTSNGLQLRKKELAGAANSVDANAWQSVTLPYPVADVTASNVLSNDSRTFSEGRYRQGSHLFNFHSWRPDYTDPEFTMSVFSDNVMNTFTNEIYYRYNQNETSNAFGFNSSYGGWFPVITAGAEYIANRTFRDSAKTIDYNQAEVRLGYSIPLSFTRGVTYKFLNLGSDYVLNQTWLTHGSKDSSKETYSYLRHFISWAQYLPTARQHIYPKLGYTVSGQYRHLLTEMASSSLEPRSCSFPLLETIASCSQAPGRRLTPTTWFSATALLIQEDMMTTIFRACGEQVSTTISRSLILISASPTSIISNA